MFKIGDCITPLKDMSLFKLGEKLIIVGFFDQSNYSSCNHCASVGQKGHWILTNKTPRFRICINSATLVKNYKISHLPDFL